MKLLEAALAVLAFAILAPSISGGLYEGLDFDLAQDLDGMLAVYTYHLENDPEFQAAIAYFNSDAWMDLVSAFMSLPEVRVMATVFNSYCNLYIFPFFDHEAINAELHDIQHTEKELYTEGPSLKSFLDDIKTKVHYEEIMPLIRYQLENNAEYRNFYEIIKGDKMRKVLIGALATKEFGAIRKRLEAMDVPVQNILSDIFKMFNSL